MNGYAWPKGTLLPYYIDAATGCPAGLDPAAVDAQIDAAFQVWPKVCGARLVRTTDRSQARIVSVWDPGVEAYDNDYDLARTDLPDNPDASTVLVNRLNPSPAAGWTLRRLYIAEIHEIGHALGLVHAPDGVLSIMSAWLNESLSGPTAYDVQNAVADCGPPAAPAPAPIRLELPDGGTLVYTAAATPTVAADVYSPTTVDLPGGGHLVIQFTPAGAPIGPEPPDSQPATGGSPLLNPLLVLAETEALALLHAELAAGAPGDVAVRNVLGTLESKIANPIVRGIVTDVLNAVVGAAEKAVAALPAA